MPSIKRLVNTIDDLFRHKIWQVSLLEDHSPRGHLYALLRICSITWIGLDETKIFSRAAALSYSTMLGIGPLIAIGVMVAGTVLHTEQTNVAVDALHKTLRFIAPQVSELERNTMEKGTAAAGQGAVAAEHVEVNPELVNLINNFIEGSRSGTLGVAGALMLVVIVIQLFISVEESFNIIWGVRRGRAMMMRIMLYWTLVTLGAVLAVAALSLMSAATLATVFNHLPFGLGATLLQWLQWMAPLVSFVLLVAVLTFFYRYIPNTNVFWGPAFVGAAIVVVLLFLNNFLAFFYFKQVLRSKDLFGSLSILPVLMCGLYIFWLFILLGGQITYAVQNVHYRSSKSAWGDLNQHSRESIALILLILIARRFKECSSPLTASELSSRIRVPTQVLNECLNRLIDLKLVTLIPPAQSESSLDYHYQPARPLGKIVLREFREVFAHLGVSPAGEMFDTLDPVLRYYHDRVAQAYAGALGDTTIEQLIEQFPAVSPLPAEAPAK